MHAEVKVAMILVQHNIPLAVADELTPLFQDIFSDGERTIPLEEQKQLALSSAVAPFFQQSLVEHVRYACIPLAIPILLSDIKI